MKSKKASGGCAYKKGGKIKKPKEVKVEGGKSKPRLDKFARGGAAKKSHKTQVNVIIGAGQKQPVPVPMAPPSGGPMMPPPAAPAPGMKSGGAAKMTAGAGSGVGRLEKARSAKKTK